MGQSGQSVGSLLPAARAAAGVAAAGSEWAPAPPVPVPELQPCFPLAQTRSPQQPSATGWGSRGVATGRNPSPTQLQTFPSLESFSVAVTWGSCCCAPWKQQGSLRAWPAPARETWVQSDLLAVVSARGQVENILHLNELHGPRFDSRQGAPVTAAVLGLRQCPRGAGRGGSAALPGAPWGPLLPETGGALERGLASLA